MGLFNKQITYVRDAADKEMTRVTLVYGLEEGNFPYHMAKLLKASDQNREILILDNSKGQGILGCLPGNRDSIAETDGMYVLSMKAYTEEAVRKFDDVIVYLGSRMDPEWADHADCILFTCNYTPDSVMVFQKGGTDIPRKEGVSAAALFFNKVSRKIKEQDVMKGVPFFKKGDPVLVCEAASEDIAGQLSFLYEGKHPLSKMSSDWRELVAEACMLAEPKAGKNYKKLTKRI